MKAMQSFGRMSAAAKRVAIAEDVLKQIKLKSVRVEQGCFVDAEWSDGRDDALRLDKDVLNSPAIKPCTCCAIGLAVVSSIRLFNKMNPTGSQVCGNPMNYISKFFSKRQAAMIETAFECGAGAFVGHGYASDSQESESIQFGDSFSNSEDRAIAIFKNIIKNKGEFVP